MPTELLDHIEQLVVPWNHVVEKFPVKVFSCIEKQLEFAPTFRIYYTPKMTSESRMQHMGSDRQGVT